MNPLAWLLGFVLPACGYAGAAGLAVPQPMDMTAIVRPSSPNTALAAPAGFQPAPDIETRRYDIPPQRLYDAIRTTAAAQPRTFEAAAYPARLQVHYVARTALLNFPDLVAVQVLPDGDGSRLIVYSRSVYGYSDLGANRARVTTWLTALGRPEG